MQNQSPQWRRDDAPYNARSFFRAVFKCVIDAFSGPNRKSVVIILYAVFALTAWKYIPAAPQFASPETGVNQLAQFANGQIATCQPLDGSLSLSTLWVQYIWNARKIWSAFFLMGVFPALIVKFVFREKLADYGLTIGVAKRTILSFLEFAPIMLIVTLLGAGDKSYYAVYPYNPLAGISYGALILHSVMYFALYYVAWEFMFRGFMQLGLADSLGYLPALMIQVLASTMLHYGHPAGETFGCIVGGILWGFLCYRTRSILSGLGQHAIMGIALDWTLVLRAM